MSIMFSYLRQFAGRNEDARKLNSEEIVGHFEKMAAAGKFEDWTAVAGEAESIFQSAETLKLRYEDLASVVDGLLIGVPAAASESAKRQMAEYIGVDLSDIQHIFNSGDDPRHEASRTKAQEAKARIREALSKSLLEDPQDK